MRQLGGGRGDPLPNLTSLAALSFPTGLGKGLLQVWRSRWRWHPGLPLRTRGCAHLPFLRPGPPHRCPCCLLCSLHRQPVATRGPLILGHEAARSVLAALSQDFSGCLATSPRPCCGGGYSHPCPLRLGPGRAAAPLSRPPRATWCPPHLEHLSRAMPPLPPHGRLLASRQDLPLLENCPLAPVPEPECPQKKDERTPPRSPLPLLSLGRKKSRRGPRSVEGTSAHDPPPTPS